MVGVLVAATAVCIGLVWLVDRTAVRRMATEERRTDGLLARVSAPQQALVSDDWKAELEELKAEVDRLPFRWEEIRNETRRLHSRAYHHVKRVKDSLSEHGLEDADIESLATELQLVDDEPGDDQGVLSLSEDVVPPAPPVEDWLARANAVKFGGAR